MDQRTQRIGRRPSVLVVGDALDAAPFLVGPDEIHELDQRHLSFEAHDAVELGNQLKRVLEAEAREMATDGEVAGHAIVPKIAGELGKAADVELEDQREADDHGIVAPDHGEDLVEVDLEIHDLYEMAAAPERGSEITQAQILLLLETDEHDSVRGRVAARRLCLLLICVVTGCRHGGSPPRLS